MHTHFGGEYLLENDNLEDQTEDRRTLRKREEIVVRGGGGG
jgi:hypothetical protein